MVTAREYGDDLLRRLLEHAVQATGALGAGLSLADGSPRSIAAVGIATVLDDAQWKSGAGPLWDGLREGRRLVVPGEDTGSAAFDPVRHGPVGDVAGEGAIEPVRGVVVAPGEWGGDEPLLLSVYLDRPVTEQDVALVDEYESLLGGALAVVEYCAGEELRAEQMLQMVQYRRVIEQAKGLVMAATGSDAATAFTTLSRASQHFNVRLRNLAVALVEHVGGTPAEGPEAAGEVVVPSDADRTTAARVWLALSAVPTAPAAPADPADPADPVAPADPTGPGGSLLRDDDPAPAGS